MNDEVAARQVRDVREVAGQQVVDADDRVARVEQRLRQVRSDEPGGAGDDDAHVSERPCQAALCSPRRTVSHMILKSSASDQFSM